MTIDALYSREILRRTTQIQHVGHLEAPHGSADRVAKLCGSTIHVEVKLQDGLITEFAQTIEACALGQASAAILSLAVLGSTPSEIEAGRDGLRGLLKGEPTDFPGRFRDLIILQSVKDFPARHASTLLAWEATLEAVHLAQRSGHV